ncbi:HugZ family protein [Endozoicomonas lisbonensis]|uniref:Heme iron utilization protein n=1 Tax=Endozoicomonas lisbonensis TaxID=3120522 RepID=A0ABV2SME2_9GAMM
MDNKMEAAGAARELLLNEYHGILSTHSHDVPGYPFGSVMPYCLDENGQPVILISRIAQHTRNIQENPKVSLIISETGINDVHKGGRLTWLGDAEKIEDYEQQAERYYAFFPQSRDYHKTHDFDFYRINLVRARFIGGFGKIFWVKNDLMTKANPFYGQTENGMVNHMNEDHVDAMVKYCVNAGIVIPEGLSPRMAGVDSEGMHLLLGDKLVRIPFPASVEEPMAVRKTLVDMARAA